MTTQPQTPITDAQVEQEAKKMWYTRQMGNYQFEEISVELQYQIKSDARYAIEQQRELREALEYVIKLLSVPIQDKKLVQYMYEQFPATRGHIPFLDYCKSINLAVEAATKALNPKGGKVKRQTPEELAMLCSPFKDMPDSEAPNEVQDCKDCKEWVREYEELKKKENIASINWASTDAAMRKGWEELSTLRAELAVHKTHEILFDREAKALKENNTKLRAALEKYGRHEDDCGIRQTPVDDCTCGLKEALV